MLKKNPASRILRLRRAAKRQSSVVMFEKACQTPFMNLTGFFIHLRHFPEQPDDLSDDLYII